MIVLPLPCCHRFWHSAVEGLSNWQNTEQRGMMDHKASHYNWETFFHWNLLMHISWHMGSRSWKKKQQKIRKQLSKYVRDGLRLCKGLSLGGHWWLFPLQLLFVKITGTEGMCQLRVRLFWRHTYLSLAHIPKICLRFMSEQDHPDHLTLKVAAHSNRFYL